MNQQEYLSELYACLRQRLPSGELESTMKYYEEYFSEAGVGREAEVIAELGTPEELARQILDGRGVGPAPVYRYEGLEPRKWTAGKIIALVLLSPIWLPLLAGGIVAVIGLVGGVGLGGLCVIAAGIFSAWCGFMAIFSPGIITTIFFGGLGLLLAAFGLVMVVGAVMLGKLLGKAVGTFCRWIFAGRKVGVPV